MGYIPCTTGTLALYTVDGQDDLAAVPVEAWDETGAAHIAAPAGALTPAATAAGFVRLGRAAEATVRPARPAPVKPSRGGGDREDGSAGGRRPRPAPPPRRGRNTA